MVSKTNDQQIKQGLTLWVIVLLKEREFSLQVVANDPVPSQTARSGVQIRGCGGGV